MRSSAWRCGSVCHSSPRLRSAEAVGRLLCSKLAVSLFAFATVAAAEGEKSAHEKIFKLFVDPISVDSWRRSTRDTEKSERSQDRSVTGRVSGHGAQIPCQPYSSHDGTLLP